MGFLLNILTGGAGIAGANNAHLAELLIPMLTETQKRLVANCVVEGTLRAGYRASGTAEVVEMFNGAPRISQLNMIALALVDVGISPSLAGEQWLAVRNPLMLPTDIKDIEVNAAHFRRKHGKVVQIGGAPIDLNTWK